MPWRPSQNHLYLSCFSPQKTNGPTANQIPFWVDKIPPVPRTLQSWTCTAKSPTQRPTPPIGNFIRWPYVCLTKSTTWSNRGSGKAYMIICVCFCTLAMLVPPTVSSCSGPAAQPEKNSTIQIKRQGLQPPGLAQQHHRAVPPGRNRRRCFVGQSR